LFYNDFAAEGLNAKSDAIYAMVKDFKQRGVPIDGVGLQMHIYGLRAPDLSSLAANMARLSALGVQVQITEMDAGIPIDASGNPRDPADLLKQAGIYRQIAAACAEQLGCTAFQTWGFMDKYTWITGFTRGRDGAPLLFDRSYAPKPAYQAVLDAFRAARTRRSSSRLPAASSPVSGAGSREPGASCPHGPAAR
jgi:endo-1,4-beta-xylanase